MAYGVWSVPPHLHQPCSRSDLTPASSACRLHSSLITDAAFSPYWKGLLHIAESALQCSDGNVICLPPSSRQRAVKDLPSIPSRSATTPSRMDVAYDHVQGESFSPTDETNNPIATDSETPSTSTTPTPSTSTAPPSQTLNAEFQEAFKAVSSSPWGTTIGGWWSQARRQGENLYQDLQKEASDAQQQASKGFSSLRSQVASHTRGISLNPAEPGPLAVVPGEEPLPGENTGSGKGVAGEGNYKGKGKEKAVDPPGAPESLPADIVKEAGTLVASLRVTAASRLKELQRAEDAADEALLKFGLNVRNFLRDAVTVTAPDDGRGAKSEVLFETQEPGTGKKVFHSSRLDAQLHAIHSTPASFTQNPAESESWEAWEKEFDAETMTEAIARDLERFEELRRAMEKLVPEKVEYRVFWMRYYFLRKAIEEEEKRRKEVLRGE